MGEGRPTRAAGNNLDFLRYLLCCTSVGPSTRNYAVINESYERKQRIANVYQRCYHTWKQLTFNRSCPMFSSINSKSIGYKYRLNKSVGRSIATVSFL